MVLIRISKGKINYYIELPGYDYRKSIELLDGSRTPKSYPIEPERKGIYCPPKRKYDANFI